MFFAFGEKSARRWGTLGARYARARGATPPTAAIWEKWLCLVETEPNRGDLASVATDRARRTRL